jgi:hypothetical protein
MDIFNDQLIGYWIKDMIYIIKNNKRIYWDSNFKYIEIFNKLDHKCKKLVDSTITVSDDNMMYLNGRQFYPDLTKVEYSIIAGKKNYTNIIHDIPPTISLGVTKLVRYKKWRPIFELICGKVKGSLPCTKLGINISSSLIKVASTRIFSKPEQCIIEMIVNSIDSYSILQNIPKVGRFGMGFFSIFYFLVDHPLRSLSILTIHNNKSVCITIKYENFLIYELKEIITESKSGTFIYLDTSKDNFTDEEIKQFTYFLSYVKYVKTSTVINYNNKDVYNSMNPIIVDFSKNYLSINDYAMGMTLDIVQSSLLIPSVSTKTILLSTKKGKYENYSNIIKDPDYTGTFSIIVNYICIVSINLNFCDYSIILSLPQNITLPVTRDDVIFSGNTKKEVIDSLTILLKKSIEMKDITYLENSIDAYINYTANQENKNILSEFKENMYHKLYKKYILVNILYSSIFSFLPDMIISNKMDSYKIEEFLDHSEIELHKDIFYKKRVIFVDNIKTTTANTYKYIFVDTKEKKSKNWIENLVLSFHEQRLYLNEHTVPSTELVLVKKMMDKYCKILSKEEQEMIRYSIVTMLSLQDRLILEDKEECIFSVIMNALYVKKLDPLFLSYYIDIVTQYYLNIVINYDYGDQKRVIRKKNNIYMHYKILESQLDDIIYNDNYHNYQRNIKNYILSEIECRKDINCGLYTDYSLEILMIIGQTRVRVPDTILYYIKILKEYLLSDLSIFEILIITKANPEIFKQSDKSNIILNCKFIYDRYLKKINKKHQLLDSYIWNDNITIKYALENFNLLCKTNPPILKTIVFPEFSTKISYTFKQLLYYVFKNNHIDLLDPVIPTLPKQESLQILEIAVDSSTSKSFLSSTITELIQNSMDAYRMNSGIQRDIHIDFGYSEPGYLYIKIKDFVGMTFDNIIALSIPFYSNKVASSLVTGEMGTGFFNIYRESEKVMIKTVKDGEKIYITDIPVRIDGKIDDIVKKIDIKNTKDRNGTSITFIVKNNEKYISELYYYVEHVLGYMDFDHLYLNNKLIQNTKIKICEKKDLVCYLTESPTISFLFTKGVPFYPLMEYFNDLNIPKEILQYIASNVIIDMGHNFYQPNQSRIKINLSDENYISLKNFIYQCIFEVVIRKLSRIITTTNSSMHIYFYICNFDYSGDSSQVLFNEREITSWETIQDVILNTPFEGTTLLKLFNNFSIKRKIFDKKTDVCISNPYLQIIYKRWVETKNKNIFIPTAEKVIKEKNKFKKYEYIFQSFVDLFENKNGRKEKITVSIKKLHPFTLAHYINSLHSIEINDIHIQEEDIIFFIDHINFYLENITNIRENKFYNKWFALSNPSTIIPHELEHARRKDDHSIGFHENIIYKGISMTFDKVSNQILKETMEKSLIIDWLKSLKNFG